MPEANSVDAQSIQDSTVARCLQVLGVEVGAAVLVGQVAHDRVALAQAEVAVVDHRHDAHRIDLAEHRIVRRPEAAAPVLALVAQAELVQHPEHLAHVDGVGASVDLEHGDVSLESGACHLRGCGKLHHKKMPAGVRRHQRETGAAARFRCRGPSSRTSGARSRRGSARSSAGWCTWAASARCRPARSTCRRPRPSSPRRRDRS